jgi:hypothetical protein
VVNASSSFNDVRTTFVSLAKQVNQLALSVIELARTVQTHHDAIHELYSIHDELTNRAKGASIDARVPLDKKEKIPNKPN